MNQDLIEKLVEVPQINYFFECYRQEDWPELILDLTLYSIYALRSSHQSPPPLSYLQDIVRKAGMIFSLEQAFPSLKKKLSQIKEDIIRMESDLQKNKDEEPVNVTKENSGLKQKTRWSSAPSKNLLNKTQECWKSGETKKIIENMRENKTPATKKCAIFSDAPLPLSRTHKLEEVFKENDDYEKSNGNEIKKSIYPIWWPKQTSADEQNKEISANIIQKKPSHFNKSKKMKTVKTDHCEIKNSSTILKQKSRKILSRNQVTKDMTRNKKLIKYADKSSEANLKSSKSSNQDTNVHFDSKSQKDLKQVGLKRQAAWVMDYSDFVKRTPSASKRNSISPSESRRGYFSRNESPHFLYQAEASNPRMLQNSFSEYKSSEISEYDLSSEMNDFFHQDLKILSESSSSVLTEYTPSAEMRDFYRKEYSKNFESKESESRESRFKTENSYYSSNPSEEAGSVRYERKDSSLIS